MVGAAAAALGGCRGASAAARAPLFSRNPATAGPLPLAPCPLPLQQQEPVGQHDHCRVVVEPPPGPALEVVESEFLLHLLVPLLDRPATLPQADGPNGARSGRQ